MYPVPDWWREDRRHERERGALMAAELDAKRQRRAARFRRMFKVVAAIVVAVLAVAALLL